MDVLTVLSRWERRRESLRHRNATFIGVCFFSVSSNLRSGVKTKTDNFSKKERYLSNIEIYLKQECIPVGCVPPAAVAVCLAWGGRLSASVRAGIPRVSTWKPPPQDRSLNFPLDGGLETCNACWDNPPCEQNS